MAVGHAARAKEGPRMSGELVRSDRRWSVKAITGGASAVPLTLLFAFNLVDELDRQAFALLAPEIRDAFGLNLTGILTIVALFTPVTILLGIPLGFFADRTRRVRLARVGAATWALFSFATGFALNVVQLALARLGSGIGKTVNEPTHNSLLSDYYPVDVRARLFSVYRAATPIGLMVSPLVAGLLATTFSWRMPFLVFAIPTLLCVVLAGRLREPARGIQDRLALGMDAAEAAEEETPPSFTEAWRTILAVRSLRRIYVALPFVGASAFGFASLLSLFYDDVYNVGVGTRGLLFALNQPWELLGLFVGAPFAQRFMNRDPGLALKFLGVSAVGVAGSIGLMAASPNLPVAVVANWLFAFTGAILVPGLYAVFSVAIPARTRALGFVVGTLFFLPGVLSLPIIGAIGDTYGIRTALLILVPIYVTGALIMASAGRFLAHDIHNVRIASTTEREVRKAFAEGESKLLIARQVDVAYDQLQVLFGVDLDIRPGETVALLGTNGAGKSTLLRAISGLTQPASGSIFFDGVDITHADALQTFSMGIVQMPGGKSVFPSLTVDEHLDLAAWALDDDAHVAAVKEQIFSVFPQLLDRREQMAGNLSGGEQQMLGVSMALMAKPKLLMIDELSLGLAPAIVEQLLEIVQQIRSQGTAIILVEQSVNVALTVADRAYFMEKGQIRFSGQTAELLDRPDILRAVFLQGAASALGATVSTNGKARSASTASGHHRREDRPASAPVLTVSGLSKHFGGVIAVNDVSFSVGEGEILGLIGPNGAGKTTIFDLLCGFLQPDGGEIRLLDESITSWGPDRRAMAGLGRSFQDARMFPSLTVAENIAVSLERHLEIRDHVADALALPAAQHQERRIALTVDVLIELLNLGDYREKFVSELSTGTRRIVDLAMAVALHPKLLLLDEPSSGIAQRESEALGPLLLDLQRQLGCSLLVIEHDMPLITSISHRMLALELGRVIAVGSPQEVTTSPQVVTSYLGGDVAAIGRSGTSSGLGGRRRRARPLEGGRTAR